jgi:hypothetical protein
VVELDLVELPLAAARRDTYFHALVVGLARQAGGSRHTASGSFQRQPGEPGRASDRRGNDAADG